MDFSNQVESPANAEIALRAVVNGSYSHFLLADCAASWHKAVKDIKGTFHSKYSGNTF